MSEQLQDWRHIWLYAKEHYKRGFMMEDLKILIGHHAALEPKRVSENDILSVMCEIVYPYFTSGNVEYKLQTLLKDLILTSQGTKRPLDVGCVVARLLSVIQLVKTRRGGKEIINLGEPDFNLLPEPEK